MRALAFLVGLLLCTSAAHAQNCTVPNTFINGTIVDATPMNQNFAALVNCATTTAHVGTNVALAASPATAFPNGVWRDDFAVGVGAPPLFYVNSGVACSNPDNGAQTAGPDGKCWVARFWPAGIDAREYGLVTSADAGPPIRAAYAAAVRLGLPLLLRPSSATYSLLTTDPAGFNGGNNGNGPYPNTTPPGLYFGNQSTTANNVTVDFGGVTLQMTGTGCTSLPVGYSNNCVLTGPVIFDRINNLTVLGQPTFLGQNQGPTGPVTQIGALGLFNLVGFNVGPAVFKNWGGAGVPLYGDWLVHGRVTGAYAPQVGATLGDFAFLQDVIFDQWFGRSANTSGNPAPQGTGLSIIYDTPNNGQNKTGISFTSTSNVTWENNDVSGFNTCGFISEGTFIRTRGNYWHGCVGIPASQTGFGLMVHDNDQIASGGVHPADVSSIGDHFSGNGNNGTAGGADFGVEWNAAIVTGSLNNVSLIGGVFDNYISGSANFQVDASTGASHHQNLLIQGNNGILGGQFVRVNAPSSGVDRIDVIQPWTPVLQFGGASTGITYTVQGGAWSISGRQMTASFAITTSSKGSATGNATVTGLPFNVNANEDCAVSPNTYGGMATNFTPSGIVQANTNSVFLLKLGAQQAVNVTNADFNNVSQIDMTLTCHTNP